MHVNLTSQVLSSSVSAVLTAFGTPDTEGTAKLCKMVDSLFDCSNVCCTHEHERKKKTFLAPYTSTEDPRFAWLEGEFLQYLNDRKQSTLDPHGKLLDVVCFCHGRHTSGSR